MTQHAPPSIMLPMPAVMAAFKRAAETLKPSTREKLCVADAQDGHLQLTLRMVLSPELELDYTFDMAPLAVEAIEILAAKIRDVEDTIAASIAATNQKLSALERRLAAEVCKESEPRSALYRGTQRGTI
ncbi:hypothetical protein SPRG_03272 [Saprolegnia parasitica CBS 223.65]|uniref:Uncharacterized protein n=1 Tax=Saprolegnia parasitica (strain CBS 223.65) TaxID=695850 RepID=A0A067CMY2_SAPPC|nr:hypothetical protein SPRG_03272 [Saprolegnia parasitica CBS 223.65]KDO32054.1 hypothetical protein SPRG_03272 [Saprolegnia parasitica CBS 223.65]|eukprot:XP_012197242.1 hypothetical protein SPRG_03272 [Saprolegnia parasitica CBS 223.65]